MSEKLHENAETLESVELDTLHVGDSLEITAGGDDERWTYFFTVEEASRYPKGQLSAVNPAGVFLGAETFELQGAGNWTTRSQNPVQKKERAFTSNFDAVYVGGMLVGKFEDQDNLSLYDRPGQEISLITLERSQV